MSKQDQIFLINSADRRSGTPTDYKYNILNAFDTLKIKRIELLDVWVPLTYYNISVALNNNSFYVDEGAGNILITIPSGHYSVTSLLTILAPIMNGLLTHVYVLSFSSDNNKITFTTTAAFSIIFIAQAANIILGFGSGSVNPSILNIVTSTGGIDFQPIKQLLIQINEFGALPVSNLQNSYAKATYIVPVDRNRNEIQRYTQHSYYNQSIIINLNIYDMSVKLFDQHFNIIDLNGSDWSIIIKIAF